MMRLLCLCLHVWVSVLSLSIESSPAAHIITQIDIKCSPGKTLLGHKGRLPLYSSVPQSTQSCVLCVYKDVLSHVFTHIYS